MPISDNAFDLIISKLCHDIISPVSAIANGVELYEDIGAEVLEEAMALIAASSRRAIKRLSVFRMAWGRAGSDEGVRARDVRTLAGDNLEGSSVRLIWPEDAPSADIAQHTGFMKVMLNLVLVAEECLPRGGAINILPANAGCVLKLAGEQVDFAQERRNILESPDPQANLLSAREAESWLCGMLAQRFSLILSCSEDSIQCTIKPQDNSIELTLPE